MYTCPLSVYWILIRYVKFNSRREMGSIKNMNGIVDVLIICHKNGFQELLSVGGYCSGDYNAVT